MAQRPTSHVINFGRPPADGDIIVPNGTGVVLGTTAHPAAAPDDTAVPEGEPERLIEEAIRMVPVLREIATESKDLAKRARDRKLKPEEFQGGTFSVSNLGMFGIKAFASIINEPQGAIMSVGAGEQRPVAKNGQLAVATVMTVTLTCDHRVVDGAIGARFLQVFKAMIEDPVTMLA